MSPDPIKITVLGDSYMSADAFSPAFDRLDGCAVSYHELDPAQADEVPRADIREYFGRPEQVAELASDADVLVVHGGAVSSEVIDALSNLALICCARGGPVNVDLSAASRRGIPVVTAPGKNAEAVADLTIGFMIMLARKVEPGMAKVRGTGSLGETNFDGAEFMGLDLGGHRLGLVGFGQVGSRVALRALAFGMEVVAADPYVKASDLPGGVKAVTREELLATSRFVSVHARQTSETVNLVDEAALAAMMPGSFLINTAREGLIDETALIAALQSGHLAGAAVDVLQKHSGGPNPLIAMESVVVTPHLGGATAETIARGARMVCDEVERFLADEPLVNVGNREQLTEGSQA